MDDNPEGFPTVSITGIGHNPVVTDTDLIIIIPVPTSGAISSDLPNYTPNWPPSLPTTLSTLTTSNGAIPENSASHSTPPSSISPNGNTNAQATGGDGYDSYSHERDSPHRPPIAAIAMVPIVLLAIVGGLIFFCMRKRRKQRQIAAAQAQAQEMKARSPTVQAYVASPLPPTRPLSRSTIPTSPSPVSPTAPQPVILGPISGSNNNYFTGIDTSDIMSVRSNERTGLGNPFADSNSLNEEPPPPYYARSIAPLSRDTSLRVSQPPPPGWSPTQRLGAGSQPARSPFDDPVEDDAVSDVSGPTSRHDRENRDDVSAVSDLSYQQNPVVGRPTV